MRRRDLLKAGLATTAIGASSPALAADDPVDRAMRRVDLQLDRVRKRISPFLGELPGFSGEPGLDGALQGALDSMIAYGSVSALSPEEQADPRVQERLWGVAETMGRSLDRFAMELGSLSEERLERLHGVLSERPDIVEGAISALDDETATLGIPKRARTQLMRTARDTAFDLAHGQKSGATKRHLARFRRLQRRVSDSDEPMDLLSRTPKEEMRARRAQAQGEVTEVEPVDDAPSMDKNSQGIKVLGGLLLALGIADGLLFAYGVAASSGWVALCVCVGVPILMAGILLMIAGLALLKDDEGVR